MIECTRKGDKCPHGLPLPLTLAHAHDRNRTSTSSASTSTITSRMSLFRSRRRKIERLDFILAGAQKSGTTALHYFLSKHPEITMGDQEEMHFFDDDGLFSGPVDYAELHKHYPPIGSSTIA